MVKCINLPRQARDKYGESSRRGRVFRQARGDGQRPDAVEAAAVLCLQVREERQTEVSAADTRAARAERALLTIASVSASVGSWSHTDPRVLLWLLLWLLLLL